MPATRGIFLFQTTILVRNGHLCPGIVRDMSLRVHNYLPKITNLPGLISLRPLFIPLLRRARALSCAYKAT